MNKEELLREIIKLPKVETDNPINTMNSINVDDLMSAIDRLNKVPTYDELLKENKKQQEVISRAIELLNNPWSFESGNKEVDEITYNKKRKVIDILKEVSE